MRGKGACPPRCAHRLGITPAYAGKRYLPALALRLWRDHPRVCGEKAVASLAVAVMVGSPPRMRGKVRKAKKKEGQIRITPAYAGKRAKLITLLACPWDHPRVCGEKFFIGFFPTRHPGSPPRMRGKEGKEDTMSEKIRITPAYAGKSNRYMRDIRFNKGSPPRMRGKAEKRIYRRRKPGITPAYAGKRKGLGSANPGGKDHPRVCGEKKKHL